MLAGLSIATAFVAVTIVFPEGTGLSFGLSLLAVILGSWWLGDGIEQRSLVTLKQVGDGSLAPTEANLLAAANEAMAFPDVTFRGSLAFLAVGPFAVGALWSLSSTVPIHVVVEVGLIGLTVAPLTAILALLVSVIAGRGKVSVQPGAARDGHLPSATSLLESAAKAYARRAVGVILTGMGNDGVDGLAAIRAAGGKTIAQNQESSVVFGMPGAAIARGIVDHVVSGDDLAATLVKLARGQEVPRV